LRRQVKNLLPKPFTAISHLRATTQAYPIESSRCTVIVMQTPQGTKMSDWPTCERILRLYKGIE